MADESAKTILFPGLRGLPFQGMMDSARVRAVERAWTLPWVQSSEELWRTFESSSDNGYPKLTTKH